MIDKPKLSVALVARIHEYLPRITQYRGKGFVRFHEGVLKFYPVRDWQNLPLPLKDAYLEYRPAREFLMVIDKRLTPQSQVFIIPFYNGEHVMGKFNRAIREYSPFRKTA